MIGIPERGFNAYSTILHELTHLYGSEDFREDDPRFDSLYNAESLGSMLGVNYNLNIQRAIDALASVVRPTLLCI